MVFWKFNYYHNELATNQLNEENFKTFNSIYFQEN